MPLITIASVGGLSAAASTEWGESQTDTDEMTLPAGYAFYAAKTSVDGMWFDRGVWWINGSYSWSVGPVTSYSTTIRLTVSTTNRAYVMATSTIFAYLIDPASHWGMSSPALLRRWTSV